MSLTCRRFVLLASALLLAACGGGSSGLSADAACDAYSDKIVECLSDDPLNDDNVKSAATTQCIDDLARVEDDNDGDSECAQAYRRYQQCFGLEATCEQISDELYDQICVGEYFDVVEFCPNL